MNNFIKAAIELEPFMLCESVGDPDPNKRKASVTLAFHGADALKKAQTLHEAIANDVRKMRRDKPDIKPLTK